MFALCLPLHCCSVFHASAYWRRKIIFLRTNIVRKTEKYSSTWDVSKVTDYLNTLASLCELNLKSLTLKTVMLCALASAQRQQTLSALDLNFRKESQDSISFVVTDQFKTSRPGKSTEITFSSSGCASICPFAALKEYISRSETLRSRNGQFVSELFFVLH